MAARTSRIPRSAFAAGRLPRAVIMGLNVTICSTPVSSFLLSIITLFVPGMQVAVTAGGHSTGRQTGIAIIRVSIIALFSSGIVITVTAFVQTATVETGIVVAVIGVITLFGADDDLIAAVFTTN